MTTAEQDFDFKVGETVEVTILVTDEDGDPFTMTGATAEFRMTPREDSLESEAVIVIEDPDTNIVNGVATDDAVEFTIEPTDSENVAPNTFFHEVRVIDSSGNQKVVSKGEVCLFASPTFTP